MSTETQVMQTQEEMWAIVELMGHGQTAGRVTKPTEWGGLMRVDVPDEEGGYRTEFYSMSAIYSVKFVSEEIARAYAPRKREITAYDTPIVTREQHTAVVRRLENEQDNLRSTVRELKHRLTQVKALPEPEGPEDDDEGEILF